MNRFLENPSVLVYVVVSAALARVLYNPTTPAFMTFFAAVILFSVHAFLKFEKELRSEQRLERAETLLAEVEQKKTKYQLELESKVGKLEEDFKSLQNSLQVSLGFKKTTGIFK